MKQLIQKFLRDTSAAVAFETVIIFPILIWAWIGAFSFFDAYRVYNTSIKATFTIADLISRQTSTIDADDIDGMGEMLAAMIRDHDGVEMRATQILRNQDGDFLVDWSEATGTQARLFTANLIEIEDRLPDMPFGERVILVESFVEYSPIFADGVSAVTFENFTLTRPRYAGQVPFDDGSDQPTPADTGDGSA